MIGRIGIALIALALLTSVSAARAEPAITPRPARVTEQPGAPVLIGDGTAIITPRVDREARAAANYLADLTRQSSGPRLVVGDAPGSAQAIRLVRTPGLAPEGYRLDVGPAGATITASGRVGLLYGAVSLWQLLTAAPDHRLAPVHIEDAPRFRWRGLMLDSARHFQSPAEIMRLLDWMALHKLNRLQWHLVDDQGWRLEIRSHPVLTAVGAWRSTPPAAGLVPGRYGGFYSQADVRRIVAHAAARGIIIVPEIEMPGHATAAILADPRIGMTDLTPANLADWGIFPSIYGVDAPAFAFLHDVLDEVMALFPSHEIAIGGDEAVHRLWHDSPAVQARMRALGLKDETALQGWFTRQIGAYLNAHGRRLVGWDDILSGGALPADDIILSWHGADGAIAAAAAGHDVIMATAPTLYLDNRQSTAASEPPGRGPIIALHDIYAYDPGNPPHAAATPGMDGAAAAHVIGVEAALWTEYVASDAQVEAMAFPRLAALAEIDWTPKDRRDWPGFVARLPAMFARYRALGVHASDGAVVPQAQIALDGAKVAVSLSRQLDLGDIRYTLDGSAPTAASARYDRPLDLPLPARLRAATFAGAQQVSRTLELPLDAVSATRRSSQQLELCTNQIALNLPGLPGADGTPAYLIDVENPCWIDRAAPLAHAGHIAVSVAALPFDYQFGDAATPAALPPGGEGPAALVVRRGCDGPILATLPLDRAPRDGRPSEHVAALPPGGGTADLCLRVVRPALDPQWVLGWVELRP